MHCFPTVDGCNWLLRFMPQWTLPPFKPGGKPNLPSLVLSYQKCGNSHMEILVTCQLFSEVHMWGALISPKQNPSSLLARHDSSSSQKMSLACLSGAIHLQPYQMLHSTEPRQAKVPVSADSQCSNHWTQYPSVLWFFAAFERAVHGNREITQRVGIRTG